MKVTPTLRSNLGKFLIIARLALAIALFALSYYGFTNRLDYYGSYLTVICLNVLAVYLLIKVINTQTWFIDEEKIQIKSLSGFLLKEIELTEIIGWAEIKTDMMHGNGNLMVLYTAHTRHTLNTATCANYYPLRLLLCQDGKRKLQAQSIEYERMALRSNIFLLAMAGFFLLTGSILITGVLKLHTLAALAGILIFVAGFVMAMLGIYRLFFKSISGEAPKPAAGGFLQFMTGPLFPDHEPRIKKLIVLYVVIVALLCCAIPLIAHYLQLAQLKSAGLVIF